MIDNGEKFTDDKDLENVNVLVNVKEGGTLVVNSKNKKIRNAIGFWDEDRSGRIMHVFGRNEKRYWIDEMLNIYEMSTNKKLSESDVYNAIKRIKKYGDYSIFVALRAYDDKVNFSSNSPKATAYVLSILNPIEKEDGESNKQYNERVKNTVKQGLEEAGINITYKIKMFGKNCTFILDRLRVMKKAISCVSFSTIKAFGKEYNQATIDDKKAEIHEKLNSPKNKIKNIKNLIIEKTKNIKKSIKEKAPNMKLALSDKKSKLFETLKAQGIKIKKIGKKEKSKGGAHLAKKNININLIKLFKEKINKNKGGAHLAPEDKSISVFQLLKRKIENSKNGTHLAKKQCNKKLAELLNLFRIKNRSEKISDQEDLEKRLEMAIAKISQRGRAQKEIKVPKSSKLKRYFAKENGFTEKLREKAKNPEFKKKVKKVLASAGIIALAGLSAISMKSCNSNKNVQQSSNEVIEAENQLENDTTTGNDYEMKFDDENNIVIVEENVIEEQSQNENVGKTISMQEALMATLNIGFDNEFSMDEGKYYETPNGTGKFGVYNGGTVKINYVDAMKDGKLVQYSISDGVDFSTIQAETDGIIAYHVITSDGQVLGWNVAGDNKIEEKMVNSELQRISLFLSDDTVNEVSSTDMNQQVNIKDQDALGLLSEIRMAQQEADIQNFQINDTIIEER